MSVIPKFELHWLKSLNGDQDSDSGVNQDAAGVAVEQHPAVFHRAALVPEEVQDPSPDLLGEGLVEVLFGCHEIQHACPRGAAGVVALGDVEGVVDDVLLVLQALALQAGDHLCWRAVLRDGVHAELLLERLPQGVPAAVGWQTFWQFRRMINISQCHSNYNYIPISMTIMSVPPLFRRLW